MSLTDKARELLADARVERGDLEQRKADLLAEREAKLAEVREEYKTRLDAMDADLALVDRLRRALDPEGVKAERAAAKAKPKREPASVPRSEKWRPRPDNFAHVFRALAEGFETTNDIGDNVPISRATVQVVLDHARNDGTVRLAGTVKRGNAQARAYRLTPAGHEQLAAWNAAMNGAPVGADA